MVLDLDKKLGQLFLVGFQGYTLSKEARGFLEAIQPGGVIFFEHNIKDKKQVKKLIEDITECIKIRPLIAVDQEGGSVERLRKICTSLPSVWGLSKVGLKELLSSQEIIASELKELGFNMIVGPVLDINSNPKNPVIGTRAISNNPQVVSEYGVHIINVFLKYKIIPVAKHFPGHGDLDIDSHLSLPVLDKTKNELNNFEFVPFKKAIQNKVPAIMVGHIQLPEIEKDKTRPASLSNAVINGLLRNELEFKGIIITDELNMKGVTKNFSLQDASYEATIAGADILLFNEEEKSTFDAYSYIKGRVAKNKNLLKRIEESYERIMLAKKRFFSRGAGPHASTAVSLKNNEKIAYNLANKVVHWVKKDLFFKPFNQNQTLDVIYPITHKLKNKDLKTILNKLKFRKYNLFAYDLNPTSENISQISKKLNKNTKKILITYDIATRKGQKQLIESILDRNFSLIVISAGLEYDLETVPSIQNLIVAYAPNYISLLAAFEKLLRER